MADSREYCEQCGAQLTNLNAIYCASCGSAINTNTNNESNESPDNGRVKDIVPSYYRWVNSLSKKQRIVMGGTIFFLVVLLISFLDAT